MSACLSRYVKEFNARTGRSGALFDPRYGSAMKKDGKKIRSAIAYLFNNAVEKHLCKKAEDYKWNFLSYFMPLKVKKSEWRRYMSRALYRAVTVIDETYEKTSCILEPSNSSYTFSDFESNFPTYYFNPYFHELTLNGDYFKPYNDDNNFKLRWRKKNGFVEISGVLTTIESVPITGATICSLPVEIAPRSLSGMIGQVQNANGVNRWFAQIEGSGDNFSLKFTRFGSGSAAASGTGIYIPVHMTYMSDK